MSLRDDGPDTSHYQSLTGPPPPWRLWTHKIGEGATYFDPTAHQFLQAAQDTGVRWNGGYFWIRPDSSAGAQFDNCVRCLERLGCASGSRLTDHFFLQLDWERTTGKGGAPLQPRSFPTLAMVEEFNDRFDQKYGGGLRITYSADWVESFKEWRLRHPEEPLWYADYSQSREIKAATYNADVLQWTSKYLHSCMNNGSKGFDMNHVYHSDTLDSICRYGNVTVPVVHPPIEIKPVPPLILEDDMTIGIFTSNEFKAQFLGMCTPDGRAIQLEWSGDGSDERVMQRMNDQRRAGAVDFPITLGALRDEIRLIGPIPHGDTVEWTKDHFFAVGP